MPANLARFSSRTGNAVGADQVGRLRTDDRPNGLAIGALAPISYPETFPDPGY